MKTGWWYLKWNSTSNGENELIELNDIDREHIGKCIIDGFTEGQIVQEDNDDEEV